MTIKKSFGKSGAEAVNKFFSQETIEAKSTHSTPNTHSAPSIDNTLPEKNIDNIKKNRVQKNPRINMAFEEELLDYMHVMVRLDDTGSVTKYVNQLIRKDKNVRKEEYKKAMELFSNI